jgi:hypothetical protein
LLCFRCGSHVQDGAEKCWNCGTVLSSAQARRAPTAEQRAQQRTGSRVFGVVFKIGDLIANRYKVKDIVGSGGAGVVYRAHDTEIDVDVAVKVINAKLVQTSDEQRLFSRQTKIARKLSHQNVVRIYDEGRDEARPYVTMQFLEGLSLRKIIDLRGEKKQVFTLAEVEPIFNQLCQALDYAHKTTFHGNLKPDNVIVLPDLLKVTDFALLRGLPRKPFLAIQKSRASNFRYLAPEVRLEVADLERSVDVYSLGVVLGEMLTGVVYDDTKPEKLDASGLDPAILAVIKRCVARAPKDRYASTQDLYADLRSALSRGSGAKAAAAAAAAGDAPTQRLEIDKHGQRPGGTAEAGKRPPPEVPPAPPKPVEIQPSLAVASAIEAPEGVKREGTDLHEIDDDMIESSIVAQKKADTANKAAQSANGASNGVHKNGANGHAAPVAPSVTGASEPVAAAPEPDLVDNPNAVELAEDEEVTIAVFDHPPMPSRPIAAEGISVRPEPGLEEISNSAIELIADPSATNVYDVDADGSPKPSVQVKDVAVSTNNRTMQPTPLPDSAIPEPAFSQVAHEGTQAGRLDEPAPATPGAPGVDVQEERTQGIAYSPKPQTRGPTAAFDGTNAPKAKKRPMTRPRMPTMSAAPVPMTSTVGGPAIVDPSTMPRPATQEALSIPSMVVPPAAAPAAPPEEPKNNRFVMITVALSLFAVLLAVVVLVIALSQKSDLEEQIKAMRTEAAQARETGTVALADAKKAEVEARAAAKAEEEAQARAAAADAAQKEAEEAAKAKEAEARRLEEEAKAEADAKRKEEAKRRAAEASAAAAERRQAAAEAAAERREERKRAAEERKKKEAREREQRDKERLAKEQEEAARRAEDRAKRLAAAEAEDEARARRDQAKVEEERRRREAEAAAKAREEERKRKEAEAAAKKEAISEPEPAAMVAKDKEPECPRGMVLIKGGSFMFGSKRSDPERNFGDKDYVSVEVPAFCVDYYEYPNGRGRSPSTKVSFKTAAARCKRRKKRLCTEEEWEKACKGPSGSRYPYANQWDPTSCNTEDDEGSDREVEKSGSFRKCRSGYNVYDMSGNVAEWTATQWGTGYVVKGGASDRPGYDGRCAARKKKKSSNSSETLGFRCCADPG